jgi:hypothetical protein
MTRPEAREDGSEHRSGFETESLATYDPQSTPGSSDRQVVFVDGRNVIPERARPAVGSRSPDVIVVSAGDPMKDLAGNVQWFDRFKVRPPLSILEILVRLVQGSIALPLSIAALTVVAAIVLTEGKRLAHDWQVAQLIPLIVLAALLDLVALRRYLYWRVDESGIHQYCIGLWSWSLPWTDIVSRELGPPGNPWVFFSIIPIMGGPYQAIILKDRQGRRRKVNRLATNGDRLDAMVRNLLNSPGEVKLAQTYSHAIREAQAISARHGAALAELQFATKDAPVVRMKLHEPFLLPVCCNCLGPAAATAPISMSPGLLGFFNPNFTRLMIPLCLACHARTKRNPLGFVARFAGLLLLIMVGTLFFTLATVEKVSWITALPVGLGGACLVGCLALVRSEIRRPTPDRLVKVVRANSRQGWMDVRFGNREYARLVAAVNQQVTRSLPVRDDAAGLKKSITDELREL